MLKYVFFPGSDNFGSAIELVFLKTGFILWTLVFWEKIGLQLLEKSPRFNLDQKLKVGKFSIPRLKHGDNS